MTLNFPFGLSFGMGILIVLAVFLFAAIRILREYERGVVFFLGRFQSVKGPGLVFVIRLCSRWCASTSGYGCSTCRRRT